MASERVSNIVLSQNTKLLLESYGLNATKVTWEDTGRSKGSCWGPNISDMTLVTKDGTLMPVIRKPNFADVTVDVPIDPFKAMTENGVKSLEDILKEQGVFADRDKEILTSSQCCVLPAELGKKTQFAVQLFNYQSYRDEPAVLVILVSKLGTSIQVLDSSNAKLYFDDNGRAKWFSVERLEDVRIRNKVEKTRVDSFKEMSQEEKLDNTLMMIQVPLKQKERTRHYFGGLAKLGKGGYSQTLECAMSSNFANEEVLEGCCGNYDDVDDGCKEMCFELHSLNMPVFRSLEEKKGHGMDMGQLGLGDDAGLYTGTRGVKLVRDERLPIRCTFQYYRVTDEAFIDEKNIIDIKEQLEQAHKVAIAQGSLVISGNTNRKTEHDVKDDVVNVVMNVVVNGDVVLNKDVDWKEQVMASFV